MKVLAGAVGLVALVVVTLGWLESPDRLTAAEAVRIAEHAYEAAGIDPVEVAPAPEAGVYITVDGTSTVPVWKTVATVEGGTIQLWLARADGESVFLDDRSADGTRQLLTDEQFSGLAEHYENPAVSRQIRRNLLLTVASGLIVLLAVRLSVLHGPVGIRRVAGLGGGPVQPAPRSAEELEALAPVAHPPTRPAPRARAPQRPEPRVTQGALDGDLWADDDPDAPDDDDPGDGDDPEAWDVREAWDDELVEQEDDDEDQNEWEVDEPVVAQPGAEEWEPMWEDPDGADAAPEGEWEPMWDDRPGASRSDPDRRQDPAAAKPAPTPARRRAPSRLRAPQRRQLHAPEAP